MRRLHQITIPEDATYGEAGLDRQHGGITLRLNQLVHLVSEDESPSQQLLIQTSLLDLGRATKTHFSDELHFLFRIGYPLVEEQIQAFKEFQTQITRAVGQIQHLRREELVDLVGRLRAWWVGHLFVQSPLFLVHKQTVERLRG